jgi:multisubunit Na+/H+ antiporter MnhF subunit
MTAWLAAAIALGAALVPLAVVGLRGSGLEGVVALELAGVIVSLGLMVLAEGFQRQSLADLGLVLVVMSFAGSLVFLRYFERRRGP